MTDGPFRNLKLSSHWKRYGEDLVSDATSPEERSMQACHSILDDVEMKIFNPLLIELSIYAQRPQMDLDPITLFEAIFDRYPRSPLHDILQKNLTANLRDRISSDIALDQALSSAARDLISITKSRLDDECICARDLGDMSHEDYRKGIERNQEAFASINPDDLCNAFVSGNKRAFKGQIQKKIGIDEGPDE